MTSAPLSSVHKAYLSPSSILHTLRDSLRRLRSLRAAATDNAAEDGPQVNRQRLLYRLADVFLRTWHLGFTAFGGPAVHFQIMHHRFVEGGGGKGVKWVDEQTYQELFAICQGLPGPGSTKMLFCLALLHAGTIPAIFVFLLWSLPGAIGMFALALGVQRIDRVLPGPVYALLSGLNASTVGIIALAAVQLAEKAIKDRLTRILVIAGACAGVCYNSLWYFPLLMALGGIVSAVWEGWMRQMVGKARAKWQRKRENNQESEEAGVQCNSRSIPLGDGRQTEAQNTNGTAVQRRPAAAAESNHNNNTSSSGPVENDENTQQPENNSVTDPSSPHAIRVRVGTLLSILFFASFITILVVRGVLTAPPRALDLFANMYLAGTVIFGGGPVVIPLLRSYVVEPGWVSSRDFLIGLAIIQAFPGPNFNFAVYLGGLALHNQSSTSASTTLAGSLLGFAGIFPPGLILAVALQSFWRVLRAKHKWVVDLLRGVNATAVGLVFTAVYRLWEIGYLTPDETAGGGGRGKSLALEPWWVVVAAVAYAESAWFKVPPALAIVGGAVLGLLWYAAVGR